MFTRRHDGRLWQPHIRTVLPNLPQVSISECRKLIHDELEVIRNLRNRIAHHEPVFRRDLADDFRKIIRIVEYRCSDTSV